MILGDTSNFLEGLVALKTSGNEYFKAENYLKAIEKYQDVIKHCEGKSLQQVGAVKQSVMSNMTIAYSKMLDWRQVFRCATSYLDAFPEENGTRMKILYWRGKASRHLDDLMNARIDIKEALRLSPDNESTKEEKQIIEYLEWAKANLKPNERKRPRQGVSTDREVLEKLEVEEAIELSMIEETTKKKCVPIDMEQKSIKEFYEKMQSTPKTEPIQNFFEDQDNLEVFDEEEYVQDNDHEIEEEEPEIGIDRNKEYTVEEVALHNMPDDAWIIINEVVYDVSGYADEHPGGPETLLSNLGGDNTEAFNNAGKCKI